MPETANEATALRPKPQCRLLRCCLFNSMIHPFASSSMCRIKSRTTGSLAFTDPLCYQFIWFVAETLEASVLLCVGGSVRVVG